MAQTPQEFCKWINEGSNGSFYKSMLNWATIKFGDNISSKPHRYITKDGYANKLLSYFIGVSYVFKHNERLFLRTILARELSMYLLTGKKEEGLLEKIAKADKDYWAEGYGTSIWTKSLPSH